MYRAKIKNFLQGEFQYSDYQCQQIKYILLSLLSEVSKLLFMLIPFFLLEKLPEFLFAVIILFSVRVFTGGIHLKHYLSCFLFSFLFLFLGVYILPSVLSVNALTMIILLNLCIVMVYLLGPVLSSTRPHISKEKKKSNSIKAVTSILVYIFFIYILQQNKYLEIGFWMIVLQTLQLGLTKLLCIKERSYNHDKGKC